MSQKGIGSFICSLLALFIPVIGFFLAIVAIVLGSKHRKDPDGRLALAGVIIGWVVIALYALFILLVFIGGIAYFGALSPSAFIPERCTGSPDLPCEEFLVTQSSPQSDAAQAVFELTNHAGADIDVLEVEASSAGASSDCTVDPVAVASRERVTVSCLFPGLYNSGSNLRVSYQVTYLREGRSLNSTSSGELYAVMQ